VNTIVLKAEAPRERHRCKKRERREEISPKEQDGERRKRNTEALEKVERHQALHHQPSSQRIHAEQCCQSQHDAA
jgi:hypothetical protein